MDFHTMARSRLTKGSPVVRDKWSLSLGHSLPEAAEFQLRVGVRIL